MRYSCFGKNNKSRSSLTYSAFGITKSSPKNWYLIAKNNKNKETTTKS